MLENIVRAVEAVVHRLLAGDVLTREEVAALIALDIGASADQPDGCLGFGAKRSDERSRVRQHGDGHLVVDLLPLPRCHLLSFAQIVVPATLRLGPDHDIGRS